MALSPQTGKTRVTGGWWPVTEGKAPTTGLKAVVTEDKESGTVAVTFTGSASNPLVFGSPPISYTMYVLIDTKNGDIVGVGGVHTEFPGFELWTYRGGKANQVFGYNPKKYGKTPFNLMNTHWVNDGKDYVWSRLRKITPQ